jgi:hypothetical protein
VDIWKSLHESGQNSCSENWFSVREGLMSVETAVLGIKGVTAGLIVSVMISTVLASYFTFSEFVDTKRQSSELTRIFNRPSELDSKSKAELDRMSAELKSINAYFMALRQASEKNNPNMDLSMLDGKTEDISRRLKVLEGAISNDPEKALVVPMLRKDHELLVKQFNDSLVASKLDYDRLWGILMLLLTSIGAAVIGLCGWALKSVFTKSRDITTS